MSRLPTVTLERVSLTMRLRAAKSVAPIAATMASKRIADGMSTTRIRSDLRASPKCGMPSVPSRDVLMLVLALDEPVCNKKPLGSASRGLRRGPAMEFVPNLAMKIPGQRGTTWAKDLG